VKNEVSKFPKKDKIIVILYQMSQGSRAVLNFEDVIVKLFKQYPKDFHLRGYPQYPDSSNHQSFYSLRRDGLIQIRNKLVSLTEKGLTYAHKLVNIQKNFSNKYSQEISRDKLNEIERIKNTDAFKLFITNKKDQIVDTDFFEYLGTTVRSERTDFKARIKTVENVIETIKDNNEYVKIIELHHYLLEKFNNVVNLKLSIGYPRRRRG